MFNKITKGIKMKITICIGSSCHLKGSKEVVEKFQQLIKDNDLEDKVVINGAFCMNKCDQNGVSVMVDEDYFSLSPNDVQSFFYDKIKGKV